MVKVAVFMGSASDEDMMKPCAEVLAKLGIAYTFTVTSAHRTPERTERLVAELEAQGCQVFICAAGMAAHLAGAVAARTTKPVLGVPLAASPLSGMDALFATVQMPPGFPVGTLALDKAGAKNAAWMAAQILALADPALSMRLKEERTAFISAVEKAAAEVENKDALRREKKKDK
jgi:5-(carboxyamino)imidazole ribonucleotide mutase